MGSREGRSVYRQAPLAFATLRSPALSLKRLVQMSVPYSSATWACLKNPDQTILSATTTQSAWLLTEAVVHLLTSQLWTVQSCSLSPWAPEEGSSCFLALCRPCRELYHRHSWTFCLFTHSR